MMPKIARQFDKEKNGKLRPKDLPLGSYKKVWWRCNRGPDHLWQAEVYRRTKANALGCVFCANRKLSVTNCLASVAPDIAKEWHPGRNKPLTPKKVMAGSVKKVFWRCSFCKHEWERQIYLRAHKGSSCPKCNSGQKEQEI